MNDLLAKDLAFNKPNLIKSDPALPKVEARGIARRQTGRFSARLHAGRPTDTTFVGGWGCFAGARDLDLTGTNDGSCVGDAGRMCRRHDSLTPEPVAEEQAWSRDMERSLINLRSFIATPARRPRLLALLVRGQPQENDQIDPGI